MMCQPRPLGDEQRKLDPPLAVESAVVGQPENAVRPENRVEKEVRDDQQSQGRHRRLSENFDAVPPRGPSETTPPGRTAMAPARCARTRKTVPAGDGQAAAAVHGVDGAAR